MSLESNSLMVRRLELVGLLQRFGVDSDGGDFVSAERGVDVEGGRDEVDGSGGDGRCFRRVDFCWVVPLLDLRTLCVTSLRNCENLRLSSVFSCP